MDESKVVVGGVEIDISGSREAYESLVGRLVGVKPSKARSLGLEEASLRAMRLCRKVGKDDVAARMKRIPGDLFDGGRVGELAVLAKAVWFVGGQVPIAKARDGRTTARLPKALVAAVRALRKRMLKVLVFFFEDDPEVAALLAHIRSQKGHSDMAADMDALGQLYQTHDATLRHTTTRYDALDARRAFDLSQQIINALTSRQQKPSAHWLDQGARLMTVLGEVYGDVLKTARWVMRDLSDETLDKRFPPLFAGQGGRPTKPKPPREPKPKPKRQPPPDQAAEMPDTPDNTPPD